MRFSLKHTLQQDGFNDPDDVLSVKNALNKTGHYEIPEYGLTPYHDRDLFKAIKSYQTDWGLTVDGIMHPNGETITSLKDNPGVKTPRFICPVCGGYHGGVFGDICQYCILK